MNPETTTRRRLEQVMPGRQEARRTVSTEDLPIQFWKGLDIGIDTPDPETYLDCLDPQRRAGAVRVGLAMQLELDDVIGRWQVEGSHTVIEVLAGKVALGQSLVERAADRICEVAEGIKENPNAKIAVRVLALRGLPMATETWLKKYPNSEIAPFATALSLITAAVSDFISSTEDSRWRQLNDGLSSAAIELAAALGVNNLSYEDIKAELDRGVAAYHATVNQQ